MKYLWANYWTVDKAVEAWKSQMKGVAVAFSLSKSDVCALSTQAGPVGLLESSLKAQPAQKHPQAAFTCDREHTDHSHTQICTDISNN